MNKINATEYEDICCDAARTTITLTDYMDAVEVGCHDFAGPNYTLKGAYGDIFHITRVAILSKVAAERVAAVVGHDWEAAWGTAFTAATGIQTDGIAALPQTDSDRIAYFDGMGVVEDAYEIARPNVHFYGGSREMWNNNEMSWGGHDRCDNAEEAGAIVAAELRKFGWEDMRVSEGKVWTEVLYTDGENLYSIESTSDAVTIALASI